MGTYVLSVGNKQPIHMEIMNAANDVVAVSYTHLSVYPLEYGGKKALVNCFIHAGNDVKKLLNSFNPDAFTNSNQCIKCAAISCLP